MPDRINILLVILSLALAMALPFELFLFSYAVLGPLHYLTQLHWLREKSFFVGENGLRTSWIALSLVIPSSIYVFISTLNITLPEPFNGFLRASGMLILIAFLFAVYWVLTRKKIPKMAAAAIVLLCFAFYLYLPGYAIIIVTLLPTLVHVYLFTLLFIFYGAKKSRSTAGMLNGLVLLLVPFILMILPETWVLSANAPTALFSDADTFGLQAMIYRFIGGEEPFGYGLPVVIKIQIFIAFAYTYHYLNWFSKTGVIGWTKGLTPKRVGGVLMLWMGVVAVYWVNFRMGVTLLFFLSSLHVVLEFPLNAIVIKEIVKGVQGKIVR